MSVTARRAAAAFFLACGLNIFWPLPAGARPQTLDDTGTQAFEPAVQMRWKDTAPARGAGSDLMTGTLTVRVHLNLQPFLRHAGRIYLVLPAQPPGPLQVSWTTQGRLLPGQVTSGGRTLVYAGPITSRFIDELLTMRFSVSGTLLSRAVPVDFHFDIDEE